MRPYISTATRYCEHCPATIIRHPTDGPARYSQRKFCSHACHAAHRKGISWHAPKRRYRNSTPKVISVARDLYFIGKLKQHEIARMFGAKQGTVSRWMSGQTWSHVP